MIALPEWHPMAVHFPLALTVTGALALSAARVLPSERHGATLAVVGTWNLCLGAVGALLALGTGLAAVASLELAPPARAAVALHVKWAIFTTAALALLAVWRGAGADPQIASLPRAAGDLVGGHRCAHGHGAIEAGRTCIAMGWVWPRERSSKLHSGGERP